MLSWPETESIAAAVLETRMTWPSASATTSPSGRASARARASCDHRSSTSDTLAALDALDARRCVEAQRRGGREVEALGAAVDRDPDPVVGDRGQLGRQPPGLVAEDPRGGSGELLVGVVQVDLARGIGGEVDETGVLSGPDSGERVGLDHDREVEDAADAGPHGPRVVGVHRAPGQYDGVGAGRVRRADHGPGVARIADVGADGHEAGYRRKKGIVQR